LGFGAATAARPGIGVVEVMTADALGLAPHARCPDPVHLFGFDPPYPLMQDADTRQRVLDAFTRVAVDKLDDTGFAMLRVPWPMPEMEVERHGPGWTLAGLDGPEIRTYRGMAILWYAKQLDETRDQIT